MKKIILILMLGFSTPNFAQLSIDSIRLQIDTTGPDSIFINYTSYLGQYIFGAAASGPSTVCNGFIQKGLRFQGKPDTIPMHFDTAFSLNLLPSNTNPAYFDFTLLWDTIDPQTWPPVAPLVMDVFVFNDSCKTTSIFEKKQESSNLILSPNPTKNAFSITHNQELTVEQLLIYNLKGKLVKTKQFPNNQIDVSNLSVGIYFVQLQTNEGILIKKLIISK